MIKAIVLTMLVVFGLFDILLIMGCAKLEKKQEEQEKQNTHHVTHH